MLRRESPVMLSNFSLGLITKVKELNGMDKRGTPDCMDVYADLDGSLHKREGSTKLNSSVAGAGSYDCHGLFDFEGTLIGSFGTSYLKMDELDGTWDALTGGTGLSDEAIECEDYSGNLFICNWGGDYIKTMQLGGTTLTNLNTTSVGGRGKHPKVYKDHLLVSGVPGYPYTFFYCFDEETEILTTKGWRRWYNITKEEKALTFNMKEDRLEWQPIEEVCVFDFKGRLNYWHSSRFDAMTTDDHKWIKNGDKKGGYYKLKRNKYSFLKTKDFFESRNGLKFSSQNYIGSTPIYSNDFVELVGWILTEGNYEKTSSAIRIYQSEVNKDKVNRIRRLASFKEYKYQGNKMHCFRLNAGELTESIRKIFPNKRLTMEFILQLSKEQLVLFYKVMMMGDGYTGKQNRETFIQKNKEHIDVFQVLAFLIGYKSKIYYRDEPYIKYPFYTLSMHKAQNAYKFNREKVDYEGKVWCIHTANKTLVARRNGCAYVSGNTAAADIDNFADGGTWPVLTHDGDTLTGWGDLSGKLFAFKRWSIHQITFLGGSPYWKNTQITKGIGTRSPKTIKNVTLKDGSEVLMFLGSNRKIYQFNGYNASAVSDNFEESNNICPISMLTLNQGALENAHAVVDTTNHWYIVFVANGGSTAITHGIVYNYYTGACWPFSNQVYGASIDAVDGNGKKWIIVGDYNGYAQRWNYGTQDQGAISTVASAPTAGGTGYTTGDILTVAGGMGGTVSVVAGSGIVTAVTKVTGGVGYTTGTGQSTVGGTGSGCTVNISAVTTAPISAYHTTPRLILSPEILAEVFQVSVSMKAISDDTVNFYHRQDYKDAWNTAEAIPLGNVGEEYYLGTTFKLGTATLGPAEVVKTKIVGLDVQGNSIQFKISDSLTTGPWTLYAYGLIGRKLGLDRQEKP